MTPYSVRLVIRKTESDSDSSPNAPYEARWVESDGQISGPFALKPPLTGDDATDLRWYLEKYHEFVGAGTRVRAYKVERQLEPWGRALFDAAFGSVEGTHVYRNLLQALKAERPVLLTLGTSEPAVLVQPWELMRDRKGPLAFRGVSIRRQLEGARPLEPMQLSLPMRLLVIVSRPTDSGFIDPRSSIRPLLDSLDRLPRGSVEVEFCQLHIEASRLLVESFYRQVADGQSIGQALSAARTRMRAEPDRWLTLGPDPSTVKLQDWFVPQLYQVRPDLSLRTDDADSAEAAEAGAAPVLVSSPEERLHGFPPEPTYRFQGRTQELWELGRAFEKHNAVVVAGGGGMGKTALSREATAWWLRVGRFEEAVFCSFEQVHSFDRAVQVLGQAIEGLDFDRRRGAERANRGRAAGRRGGGWRRRRATAPARPGRDRRRRRCRGW